MECQVVLTDPLSSRIHATIHFGDDAWWVKDAESRNGTFVNGQKIDEAQLISGSTLKLGASEFTFEQSEAPPSEGRDLHVTQTVVRNQRVGPSDSNNFALAALSEEANAQDFLVLHQLCIKLLRCTDPDEVLQVSLDLLHTRTAASVVGFLWVSDDGSLKPKLVIPEDQSSKITLSSSLTRSVCKKREAVWVANQTAESPTHSLRSYSDALCVPLISDSDTIGAIHIYTEQGKFRQSDFDVSVSLANIMCVALVRARQQASLEVEHKRLVEKNASFSELIGESEPMLDLKSKISRIGRASGCVLIRGESGAGKELVARALHQASPRGDRPMLSVNCAAIPHDLMESQLFGHKKGAFTGAEADHTGWFEQADSGTLFLDEVGEMTLAGQAKLLRILEGHPFLPVGGTKEVTVDVRVIAATNRDLREFVAEKRFREDLYYRLSVFELFIPPLRERGNDIDRLVDFFLEHFSAQHGRTDLRLAAEAREKLLSYQWPGNVRQLRNVIDSAVVMADGNEILPQDLGLRDTSQDGELESLRIDYWERKLIKVALDRTDGKVPGAAKLLGIGRATLYRKIEEYGIDR